MQTEKLDTNALFTQYVNVINRAIGEHKDEFPFEQLVSMGEKVLGDKKIGAAVYKDSPDSPHDYFTLTLENGKLRAMHGKDAPNIEWKLSESHITNVVKNPAVYIENPTKLDLDWLKTRMKSAMN